MEERRKQKQNFLNACIIVAGTIPQSLREYFRISWQQTYKREWGFPDLEFSGNQYWNGDSSCSPEIRAEASRKVKHYVKSSCRLKDKVLSGDIYKWDQTLLSRILEESSHRFTDSRTKEAIIKLRDLRNEYYGHAHSATVSDIVLADLRSAVISFCTDNGLLDSLREYNEGSSFVENQKLQCLKLLDQQLEAECMERVFSLKCAPVEPDLLQTATFFRRFRNIIRTITVHAVSGTTPTQDIPGTTCSAPQQINSQSTPVIDPSAAVISTDDSSHHLIIEDFPEVAHKGIYLALEDLMHLISEGISALTCCADVRHSYHTSAAMELKDTAVAMHFAGTPLTATASI